MNYLSLFFTFLTAATTVAANIVLRMGLARGGGFGVSDRGIFGDLVHLALQPIFVGGVLLYGTAALLWFHVLSTGTLAVAYVLLVGTAFIGMTILDTVIFGSSMGLLKLIGIVTIFCGILLVALSSMQ